LHCQINQSIQKLKQWKIQKHVIARQPHKLSPVLAVMPVLVVPAPVVATVALKIKKEKRFYCFSFFSKFILILMSLYTFSNSETMPQLKPIKGLRFEESTNLTLLSDMSGKSEGELVKRFANDNLAFVAFLNDVPAGFGWMARGKAYIGELGHDLILPLRNRYLWNFRTLLPFRGMNIYPSLLQYILKYEGEKSERFWIIHAPENKSSLKGIRKAGFRYTGKLFLSSNSEPSLQSEFLLPEEQKIVESMGFKISSEPATSCWGCHSPFIKSITSNCCCLTAEETCFTV
jgi:hypothetical protein